MDEDPDPMTPPPGDQPPPRAGWGERLRDQPGRAVVDLIGGILAATLAYAALVVATLSWCIPDSCERSITGIVVGTVLFGLAATAALRWLSLRRLDWSRAALVGAAVALALVVYELIDRVAT